MGAVGKSDFKEGPKSDLDFDLGFVKIDTCPNKFRVLKISTPKRFYLHEQHLVLNNFLMTRKCKWVVGKSDSKEKALSPTWTYHIVHFG